MHCRNTYIQVDLDAIAENTRALKAEIGNVKMLAVVKANAYGHGLLNVAKTALNNGAEMLGVAIPEEGVELRGGGVTAPILVLGGVNDTGAEAAVRYGLIQTVFDRAGVERLSRACEKLDRDAEMHLKLDTGMGRIGVRTEDEVKGVLDALKECPRVHMTGVFTHFSDADGESEDYTRLQMERFEHLCSLLPGGITHHAAASAAMLRFPATRYDMVRAGIALYGYSPVETKVKLRPALSYFTEIVYIKTVHPGDQLSYGRTFTASAPMKVATLAVGYGDGYHRLAGGEAYVLIGGKKCKVLGRVCMDQMLVDVTDTQASVGDTAVLLGRQGNEQIDAEQLAKWANTICWEVLLSATARVPIEYIGSGKGTENAQ